MESNADILAAKPFSRLLSVMVGNGSREAVDVDSMELELLLLELLLLELLDDEMTSRIVLTPGMLETVLETAVTNSSFLARRAF
jgi:hypothetical protein